MSKLLDDIKRAEEARLRLDQTQTHHRAHSGVEEEKLAKSASHRQAEADLTQQAPAWEQTERAARERADVEQEAQPRARETQVHARRELDERAEPAKRQRLELEAEEGVELTAAARAGRARWLPAAAVIGTALAIGIGIGSLIETGSEPAAVLAPQRAAQVQSGPPLQLRLDTDLEQFARRASATAPRAAPVTTSHLKNRIKAAADGKGE